MSEAFLKVVNMSLSASWLVLVVLLVRFILKKAPKWINVFLWALVAVRLICPISVESRLSLIPDVQIKTQDIVADFEVTGTGEILDAQGNLLIEKDLITNTQGTGQILDADGNVLLEKPLKPATDHKSLFLKERIHNLAPIWLVGIILMCGYALCSYLHLKRKLLTSVSIREGIKQSEFIQSPFVFGVFRPVIYLPYGIAEKDTIYVIAHEQAHIRRKDHWWKPLGFLLLTVYWFNPLMWVAYVLLCRDIELACDEKVIAELGNDQRADYTQALVACSVNRRMISACPLAFGEVGVKERVKSIMNYRKPAFWVVLLAILACIAVAVCFLTDPIDSAEEPIETDGMQMQQVSFLYDTEQGYYLLIGADRVQEIQVSLPDSGGGVVNADGSSFKKGEKVYLEPLQGITDLRGLSITALGKNGEVLYGLSIPEDASMEDVINTVGSDGWLLAPTEHIVGPTIDSPTIEEITDQLHELQGLQTETESSDTDNAKSAYENNGTPSVQALYEEYTSACREGAHIYVDLDEDGVQELFIWRPSSTSEIATISENKAVAVMISDNIFLCEGGVIGRYSEGGGGRTMFYYRIENQAAVIADVIVNTFQDDAWYRSTDPNLEYASPENMTRITKEEAYEVSKQYAIAEENIPSKPDCTTWLYGEE